MLERNIYNTRVIKWFQRICILERKCNESMSDSDTDDWEFIMKNLLYDDESKHLPVPVYSYVKPSLGTRFVLHLLLSLGHFETELDLLLHRSLRDSLKYAKLIGEGENLTELQRYSNELLKTYIEEQLVYFPNSSNVTDSWIIDAGELLDSIIIRDEICITDMPPVLQCQLEQSTDSRFTQYKNRLKLMLIVAARKELENVLSLYTVPTVNELMSSSLENDISWNIVSHYRKSPYQSIESYKEQIGALKMAVKAIDRYINGTEQNTYIKCQLIAGAPGSGKSFLALTIGLYAISKGLVCGITSMMARRAVQIGGEHLHKMFCIPVSPNLSVFWLAEKAIIALMSKPEKLKFIRILNILLIDEIGQLSSEFLSSLDIILRRIRNNDIFLGGVFVISTIDHKQLPPIKGKPFLTSPHVLSCFDAYILKKSVRANNDKDLVRIQEISRMNPKHYIEKPDLLIEFKNLLSKTCTFVPTWDSPIITPNVHRVYGKKKPAKEASEDYLTTVKGKLKNEQYLEVESLDVQLSYNSHEEWQTASDGTRAFLDHILKEPRVLLFFIGGKYTFTYNEEGKFSQSQLGLLLEMPEFDDVKNFRKIPMLVAPPGIKDFIFETSKSKEEYYAEGWTNHMVGVSPIKTNSVQGNLKAQRKQYGLKPYVTSTVHASMGDTLQTIATEVSFENAEFRLWEKAQVIVLLSRTRKGKDLIFVGEKKGTIRALCLLIQTSSQWIDFMLIAKNTYSNNESLSYLTQKQYPFRIRDISLPLCNTGYVYMLVSTKDHNQNYIGQTMRLGDRLDQHNRGYGTTFTSRITLRPWFLIAYVCGFDKKVNLMLYFEARWQKKEQNMLEWVIEIREC